MAHRSVLLALFIAAIIVTDIVGGSVSLRAQSAVDSAAGSPKLTWREMPSIPDELGLAGPVVGVHGDHLLVAGGANFARPVWDHDKQWHDRIYALELGRDDAAWKRVGRLSAPRAYAACVSTHLGIAVLGGNDARSTMRECWLIKFNDSDGQLVQTRMPDLPEPSVNAQACCIGENLYLCCGQVAASLSSATAATWRFDLAQWRKEPELSHWQRMADCPGGARALHMVASLVDDAGEAVWIIGGRHEESGKAVFLSDVWRFDPAASAWQQRSAAPVPIAAGGAAAMGVGRLAIVSGDDGKLFDQTDDLRDRHPGFARRAWIYDAARDHWSSACETPANQVTTIPVPWKDRWILASGETRPRVRTNQVWEIRCQN